jgi:NADH-quinone oxidoreductase subunit M
MGICLFSSLGLPGLNGFVGEFLIFKGSFPLATWATALSVIGLLLTAIFILTLIQKVFHGPENPEWSGFPEMTFREVAMVLPGICLIFLLGVYPQIALRMFNSTVAQMVEQLKY